jgi:hypothetical protein
MASNQPHTKRDVGGQGKKDKKTNGDAPVKTPDTKDKSPAKPGTKPSRTVHSRRQPERAHRDGLAAMGGSRAKRGHCPWHGLGGA